MILEWYVTIAGAIILCMCLYFYLTRNFNYWKDQNVPYIKPWFFFGNIFSVATFQQPIGDFLYDLHKAATSNIFGFFSYDQPFLLIRDPEIMKRVLVKDFDHFNDRSIVENQRDDKYGSSILFVLKNPAWRQTRMKITPALASGKIKNMTPLMVKASHGLIEYIDSEIAKNNKLFARELSMKFTTDVITSCAFGITANSFKHENAEFRVASRRIFENNFSRGFQFNSYFFAPFLVRLFKMKFLDPQARSFMQGAFQETLMEREKNPHYRGDLIDIIIQLKKSDENITKVLTNDILVSQAMQFFLAGFETTGSTIFFTLYELGFNLPVQEKLRKEIRSVMDKHKELTYEAIKDMTYLNMVVSETLRKYPVVPFLDRRCTKTYRIPETNTIIKKGMPVYISLLGLHYDSYYFPEPENFDPERFSPDNKNKLPGYVYMPFGEGLHNCIGARFALLNAKVGLIALILNFEVSVCHGTPYPMKFNPKGFLLAPLDDIKLQFKKSFLVSGG